MILLLPGNTTRSLQVIGDDRRHYGWLLTRKRTMTRAGIHGLPYGVDNQCYTGRFEPAAYTRILKRIARTHGTERALFAAAPDVVGNARATLQLARTWLPLLRRLGFPAALVAQDGLEALAVPWHSLDALFIGGTTAWKLSPAAGNLMAEARDRGKHIHVGRVNSFTRVDGLPGRPDSIDGTHFRFRPNKYLRRWHRQYLRRLQAGAYPYDREAA